MATLKRPREAPTARRGRPIDGGDRRAALLHAAGQLLTGQHRVDDVTVAEVCRLAGCGAPTLYHHFGDRQGLLRATCQLWYAELLEAMRAAAEEVPSKDRLAAMARVYALWAAEEPGRYRVLFMDQDAAEDPPRAGLDLLAVEVQALRPDLRETAAFRATMGVWATMHGVAALLVAHPRYGRDRMADLLVDCLAAQLRAG